MFQKIDFFFWKTLEILTLFLKDLGEIKTIQYIKNSIEKQKNLERKHKVLFSALNSLVFVKKIIIANYEDILIMAFGNG